MRVREWSRYTKDEKQSLARGLETVLREGGAPDAEAFLAEGDGGVLVEVPAPPYQGDVDRYGRAPLKVRNAWAEGAARGIRILAERVGIDLTCHGEHSKYGAGHGVYPHPDSGFVHITVPWADADRLLAALAGVAPIVPAEEPRSDPAAIEGRASQVDESAEVIACMEAVTSAGIALARAVTALQNAARDVGVDTYAASRHRLTGVHRAVPQNADRQIPAPDIYDPFWGDPVGRYLIQANYHLAGLRGVETSRLWGVVEASWEDRNHQDGEYTLNQVHIAEAIVRFEPDIDYDRFRAYMHVMRVHATDQNYAEAREPSLRTEREAAERAEREAATQKLKAEREARIRAQEARAAAAAERKAARQAAQAGAAKPKDVFYVVTGTDRVAGKPGVKFGISNGNGEVRLSRHARDGYDTRHRLFTGLPEGVAREAENGMLARLKGAGHRPLHGREYYPQAALGLILDSLDGDLTPAADSVDKEVQTLTG
ncbi:hypothetical protein [Streptomyces sp. NEAU-S7GS2]|uniref:hypothetical protein n=1 Tax=Streptomyces sp. NEAU-S7GS2 TaxID=2202000 RepID=UPI000D6EEAB0|nr:hypothetical protein [Streptomyces sp. NEAU-S7GS2]AWN30653.1 hypothetical protein DKG71_35265 [Streptomyces sp. NEAU-S7GS2]